MSRRSPRGNSGGREVVEVLLAGEDGLKGSQEIGSAGTLTNVPGGAQSLRTHGVRGIGVPAQYKHAGGGITAADLLENVEAVLAGDGDREGDEGPSAAWLAGRRPRRCLWPRQKRARGTPG